MVSLILYMIYFNLTECLGMYEADLFCALLQRQHTCLNAEHNKLLARPVPK